MSRGLTKPQTAQRLGLKEGTVSMQLDRARGMLRQLLSQRGVGSVGSLAALIALGTGQGTAVEAQRLRTMVGGVDQDAARAVLASGRMPYRRFVGVDAAMAAIVTIALGLWAFPAPQRDRESAQNPLFCPPYAQRHQTKSFLLADRDGWELLGSPRAIPLVDIARLLGVDDPGLARATSLMIDAHAPLVARFAVPNQMSEMMHRGSSFEMHLNPRDRESGIVKVGSQRLLDYEPTSPPGLRRADLGPTSPWAPRSRSRHRHRSGSSCCPWAPAIIGRSPDASRRWRCSSPTRHSSATACCSLRAALDGPSHAARPLRHPRRVVAGPGHQEERPGSATRP